MCKGQAGGTSANIIQRKVDAEEQGKELNCKSGGEEVKKKEELIHGLIEFTYVQRSFRRSSSFSIDHVPYEHCVPFLGGCCYYKKKKNSSDVDGNMEKAKDIPGETFPVNRPEDIL